MLPSKQRLSRQQVTDLLKNPEIKVVFNRIGTLKYVKNLENKRFTVVTSSKNQKKAVLRNKVRRQLYSLVPQGENPSFIGIFYVSKGIYNMSFIDIKRYFHELLQKIA